jgi:hypothetical protein
MYVLVNVVIQGIGFNDGLLQQDGHLWAMQNIGLPCSVDVQNIKMGSYKTTYYLISKGT